MGTVIRAELSENNKYWISKHRYYELKHFCLQYPVWKKAYAAINDSPGSASIIEMSPCMNLVSDRTGRNAVLKAYYAERIELIERTAYRTDHVLGSYILRAVTEELSYTYLHSKLEMPCGRDMYYDRYRKFFWLLSNARD